MQRKQKGFTLVEILIVVIILGILAAIIIPQFTEASGSAKESTLESNLQTLKSQCELYKVQHNDLYPWQVPADGSADSEANLLARLTGYTDADGVVNPAGVKDNTYRFGPYFQNVPVNPFCSNVDAEGKPEPTFGIGVADAPDDGTDWIITDITSNSLEDAYPGAPGRVAN